MSDVSCGTKTLAVKDSQQKYASIQIQKYTKLYYIEVESYMGSFLWAFSTISDGTWWLQIKGLGHMWLMAKGYCLGREIFVGAKMLGKTLRMVFPLRGGLGWSSISQSAGSLTSHSHVTAVVVNHNHHDQHHQER